VPGAAISNGRAAVVDAQGHVAFRSIVTGATREGRVEVTSGLKAGDRIVTEKLDQLKEGQLVKLPEQ
jgi:hypothetical protein